MLNSGYVYMLNMLGQTVFDRFLVTRGGQDNCKKLIDFKKHKDEMKSENKPLLPFFIINIEKLVTNARLLFSLHPIPFL